MKKDIVIKNISKVLIIVSFIVLAIIVAGKHEPWSDEAQSFLLARDNTIGEMFKYIKYEGTPGLWIFIIKIFILLGGTYETFWILPIFFSVIGLIIFEFKVKCPWYIKVIFPFTYFIFYQYSIVARSYCLVFPALMAIAWIYNKRFEKPILYSIILLFLMNISAHTLVIAGSLFLIFIIDANKDKKLKDKKVIIATILIFIELLLTFLYAVPASDCPNNGNGGANLLHVFSEATLGSNFNILLEFIISVAVLMISIYETDNAKDYQVIEFILLFFPVTLIFLIVIYQGWHIGIIWLLLFTYFIITDKINTRKLVKILVLLICITQIYWTISSVIYDYNNKYSASRDVATFLKENNYEEKTIYGLGYSVTGINPYFEYNLWENRNTSKSFMLWSKNRDYMTNKELIEGKADIYVVSTFYLHLYDDVIEEIENQEYEKYEFYGHTYIKTAIYEPEGYIVYIKKD